MKVTTRKKDSGGSATGRIAILRALELGDLMCALPAFRSLRRAHPGAEVTLIGLPWARDFAARFSRYIDRFIEFPGYPGLPERKPVLERLYDFLASVREQRFDLLIQMHGDGRVTNELAGRLGARRLVGFRPEKGTARRKGEFLPYPSRLNEVHRHLELMRFMNCEPDGDRLEFPISESERAQASELTAANRLSNYVCMHPGARADARRWPVDGFLEVAAWLVDQGLKVVVTGVDAEQQLCETLAAGIGNGAVNLCGKTSLGCMAALLEGSQLFIGNDTGISHICAALDVRSVVVFTGSDSERWAPLDRSLHRICVRPQTAGEVLNEARMLMEEESDAA